MTNQPTRVLNLLTNASFEVRADATLASPPVSSAIGASSYRIPEKPLELFIFEFPGQRELDGALGELESWAQARGRNISFSQNGSYLLGVLVEPRELQADGELEFAIDEILGAFAGQVER